MLKAADLGHKLAQFKVGVLYTKGVVGRERDFVKARDYFGRAASQGHPQAQYNLAVAHMQGDGGTKDMDAALSLLQSAAAKG